MLFDDDFALGHVLRGNDGFGMGGLDDVFGGPSRWDAGEVIVTGRVPGSLYVDDFSEGETGLEYILPLVAAENAINIISFEGDAIGDIADLTLIEEPQAPAGDDEDAAPGSDDEDVPAALKGFDAKEERPLVLNPGQSDDPPPVIDISDFLGPVDIEVPVAPEIVVTPPTMDGPPATIIGGRAYQSLSFLIIDTPFVYGDDYLPVTLRPPINDLLGLAGEDEDDGNAWVLPVAGRSWLLH